MYILYYKCIIMNALGLSLVQIKVEKSKWRVL